MNKAIVTTFLASAMLVGTAFAHDGVENPAVMARMDSMKAINTATATLGKMAGGSIDFDAAAAQAAATALAEQAGQITTLFAEPEEDPKSKARPAIWESFDDFAAIAMQLESAASGATSVDSLGALQAAMGDIGGTCRACHRSYRSR